VASTRRDYITVSNLNLNGVNTSNLTNPTVEDSYAMFTVDDVTNNHTAISTSAAETCV
jgi:hypothetical protein